MTVTAERDALQKKWDAIMNAPGNKARRGPNAETLKALRKAERNYERMSGEFHSLKTDWIEANSRHRKQIAETRRMVLVLLRSCATNNPKLIECLEAIYDVLEAGE